jgi:hypothetical protein
MERARRAILACRETAISMAFDKNVRPRNRISIEARRRRYWHQPSVVLLSQDTAQLPTLLHADSSALRTVGSQSSPSRRPRPRFPWLLLTVECPSPWERTLGCTERPFLFSLDHPLGDVMQTENRGVNEWSVFAAVIHEPIDPTARTTLDASQSRCLVRLALYSEQPRGPARVFTSHSSRHRIPTRPGSSRMAARVTLRQPTGDSERSGSQPRADIPRWIRFVGNVPTADSCISTFRWAPAPVAPLIAQICTTTAGDSGIRQTSAGAVGSSG